MLPWVLFQNILKALEQQIRSGYHSLTKNITPVNPTQARIGLNSNVCQVYVQESNVSLDIVGALLITKDFA